MLVAVIPLQRAAAQDSGVAVLEGAAAAHPSDSDLLRRLAAAYAAEGQLDRAQQAIDRAARLAPRDNDVALARANILLWRGALADAETQAGAVAAADPQYPGLAEFRSAAATAHAARGVRIAAISVDAGIAGVSFPRRGGETWTRQSGTVVLGLSPRDTLAGAVEVEQRIRTDTRLSAELAHRIPGGYVAAALAVTPHADFRERWSVRLGGQVDIAPRVAVVADAKLATYTAVTVVAIGAGLEFRPAPDVTIKAMTINLMGGGSGYRLGGSLRAAYQPEGKPGVFVSAAEYPDAEAGDIRRLRSFAVGAIVPIDRRWTLRVTAEDDRRQGSYRRRAVTVGFGWRFGEP